MLPTDGASETLLSTSLTSAKSNTKSIIEKNNMGEK
jgi:hypothetical protein